MVVVVIILGIKKYPYQEKTARGFSSAAVGNGSSPNATVHVCY